MLFLIKDLLDFSQIESKSIILNFTDFNVRHLIRDCIDFFEFKAKEKGIHLCLGDSEEDIIMNAD